MLSDGNQTDGNSLEKNSDPLPKLQITFTHNCNVMIASVAPTWQIYVNVWPRFKSLDVNNNYKNSGNPIQNFNGVWFLTNKAGTIPLFKKICYELY